MYYEFGSNIFNEPILGLIIVYLGFLGFVLFRMRWASASKKPLDEKLDEGFNKLGEKLDELIEEMRNSRNEPKQ